MRVRSLVIACLAIAAVCVSAPVHAQDGANIDLNAFRPAMDSRGYITVNASQTLGSGDLSFGLVSNWGHKVLELENGDNEFIVSDVFTPTLVGAVGLKLGLDFELGISVPFNLVFGDREPDFDGGTAGPNAARNFKFEGQGVGDIGLHLKTRFASASTSPLGIAVIGSVYLPTATSEDEWLGNAGVVPQVIGVLDKEIGRQAKLKVALNGGVRLRLEEVVFVDDRTDAPSTGERVEAPSLTIPVGLGIAYAIKPQVFDVVGEVFGAIPTDGENYFPLEAIAGIKVYLARNSFLSLGGGLGLIPEGEAGANPDFRAFLGIVFEPNVADRDGDGIPDNEDRCPDDPEDYDDFEDADGCPDPDNDGDGILDVDDRCPNEPEDMDGDEDEDGCPEGDANDRDGDGILDDEDQCPDDPEDLDGFEDEDGCPDPDNDGDGILDVDDLCPDDPEDFDKWEDEDGCPDPDNDRDRILDVDDQCPNEPETYNGVEDEDGCPDRGRVVVTDTKIEILDKIYFEYNSAVIKRQSYPILDAVAATLQGNPDIKLVEIQGHTDSRGSDSYNLKLSDERAKSVRQYLIDQGIKGNRLQAQGYGETQPIDPRSNEAAWAKNRRVEFLIVKRAND